jgi:hypothetical protein
MITDSEKGGGIWVAPFPNIGRNKYEQIALCRLLESNYTIHSMAHPHTRNDYLDSLSSLTSLSSEASVELYKARIKPGIDVISKSQATLQELANAAEKVVNEKFALDCRSIFKYTKDSNEMSVKLGEIMLAMLASAEECGGESGKRYVASAILACSKEEDEVAALAALGTTWLTHLLFICPSYYLMVKIF